MTISRNIEIDTEGVSYPSWAVEAARHGVHVALDLLAPDVAPERCLLTPQRADGESDGDLDAWAGDPPLPPVVSFVRDRVLAISYPAIIDMAGCELPSVIMPLLAFAAGAGVGRIAATRGKGMGSLRVKQSLDADMGAGLVAGYCGVAAGGWKVGVITSESVFFFLTHLSARAATGGPSAVWTGPLGWSVAQLARKLRLGTTPGSFEIGHSTGVPLTRLSDVAALMRYVSAGGAWPVSAISPGAGRHPSSGN